MKIKKKLKQKNRYKIVNPWQKFHFILYLNCFARDNRHRVRIFFITKQRQIKSVQSTKVYGQVKMTRDSYRQILSI